MSLLTWYALASQSMSQIDLALTSELPAARSELLAYSSAAQLPHDPPRTGSAVSTLIHNGTAIDIVGWSGGRLIAASADADVSPASQQWATGNDAGGNAPPQILTSSLGGGTRTLIAHLQSKSLNGTVELSTSLGPYNTAALQTAVTLGIAVIVLLILAGAVAFRLTGAALQPIHQLSVHARAMTAETIGKPIEVVTARDEVGELAQTLELMRARLAESFEQQRRLRTDAAHELRTPLAMLRAEIDVTLSKDRSVAEYRDAMKGMAADVEHLTRIVNALLTVARADSGALDLQAGPVPVGPVVSEAIARTQRLAPSVVCRAHTEEGAVAMADPMMLRQALDNLLGNAARYARHLIEISVATGTGEDRGSLVLSIDDDGPGIPAEDRARVLEPFARRDEGRSRESGGAGLGLAVTQAIVARHGGSLVIDQSPLGGARLIIRLPVAARGTGGTEGGP